MTLRDRLLETRHDRFVGREAERALFERVLDAEALPFHVLHVYGPGGIGKTALLGEFQRLCRLRDVPAAYLDGRNLDPSPEVFAHAVDRALAAPGILDGTRTPGGDGAAPAAGRQVLLVDTYEVLDSLDAWLRQSFLPEQSEALFVVIAGRHRPHSAWRTDLGWQEEVQVLPLRNFSTEESLAFLEAQGVSETQGRAAIAFTHGHPLALALVAERCRQQPNESFAAAHAPDVVRALLERFLEGVPSAEHREALEAAALVRVLSESLLATLLDREDVQALFGWLRDLAFMEAGPHGLFPHDVAREVLVADLQWRDPEGYARLHERARHYYTDRLQQAGGDADRHGVLGAYVFLYRGNPVVQPFFDQLRTQWQKAGARSAGTFQPAHAETLRAMVAQHEGEDAAALVAHWLDRQPDGAEVFCDEDGTIVGFMLTLALERMTNEDRAADPATEAAWGYLHARAPLREGERALFFRFWMDAEAYQGISAVQSLIFARTVRHYLATSHLACSFLACADPDFWGQVFAFADLQRYAEADFTVGDKTYGVFGHDWRATPPTVWLDALAGRAPGAVPAAAAPPPRPRLLVLSEEDFAEAVHEALQCYARPHRLQDNPLLRSRLVVERSGPEADEAQRIEALRGLLAEEAQRLDEAPREQPYYRALHATYLKPAPTQAMASERLDVPFSTYRRHLKRGIEHVVEALWRQETAP